MALASSQLRAQAAVQVSREALADATKALAAANAHRARAATAASYAAYAIPSRGCCRRGYSRYNLKQLDPALANEEAADEIRERLADEAESAAQAMTATNAGTAAKYALLAGIPLSCEDYYLNAPACRELSSIKFWPLLVM